MNRQKEHLDTLTEIRSLMERSSRFISLSGMSGVGAGIAAILGAVAVSMHTGISIWSRVFVSGRYGASTGLGESGIIFYIVTALCVIALATIISIYFTARKAKASGRPVWDNMAKRVLVSLLIPLVTGGVFCFILYYHGAAFLVSSAMLIFYGLALINASKLTIGEIQYLGFIHIALGIIAGFAYQYSLLLWVIGFGLMHIIYGIYMHYKYER